VLAQLCGAVTGGRDVDQPERRGAEPGLGGHGGHHAILREPGGTTVAALMAPETPAETEDLRLELIGCVRRDRRW